MAAMRSELHSGRWLNVNESICRRADRLAELGYAAFVADLFGAGVRPGPPQPPMTVVGPFLEDRILSTPMAAQQKTVVSKILVLHGDADPVVSLESVIAFREEMRLAQANWQINIYSDAKHSFSGEGVGGDRTPEAGLHPPNGSKIVANDDRVLARSFRIV